MPMRTNASEAAAVRTPVPAWFDWFPASGFDTHFWEALADPVPARQAPRDES
ncbi:MAG TPA: hypothetical protein VGZ32_24125 [Actinocrinis sp.]|jgi:hypothetical protein|uniref:hypothetical protein n=1 Tax=Actinocrinis sp. TaxID=1920516 RepID=UPI002DDCEBA0|nr:hypothetical protein [Actinocrinis sp.]HEV3173458.1 hypothetical protein [Actinocrinis sp.]